MFFTHKTRLNQYFNQNRNSLTTDITTDFKIELKSKSTSILTLILITYRYPHQNLFLFIQDFMQKKAGIQRIPAISTMYKILHINFTKKEKRTP